MLDPVPRRGDLQGRALAQRAGGGEAHAGLLNNPAHWGESGWEEAQAAAAAAADEARRADEAATAASHKRQRAAEKAAAEAARASAKAAKLAEQRELAAAAEAALAEQTARFHAARRDDIASLKHVATKLPAEPRDVGLSDAAVAAACVAAAAVARRSFKLTVKFRCPEDAIPQGERAELNVLGRESFGDDWGSGMWSSRGKPQFDVLLRMSLVRGGGVPPLLAAACSLQFDGRGQFWIVENLCVMQRHIGEGAILLAMVCDWLAAARLPNVLWVDIDKGNRGAMRLIENLRLGMSRDAAFDAVPRESWGRVHWLDPANQARTEAFFLHPHTRLPELLANSGVLTLEPEQASKLRALGLYKADK